MATAASESRSHERFSKKRPFAWMKRLKGGMKGSSINELKSSINRTNYGSMTKPNRHTGYNASPANNEQNNASLSHKRTENSMQQNGSEYDEDDSQRDVCTSNKSRAPTLATNPETVNSDTGQSKGTSNTVGGGLSSVDGGENSIFTSSNHSSHSLATTLTTMQSAAPSHVLNQGQQNTTATTHANHQSHPSQASTHLSIATPVSAIPAHVTPHGRDSHQPTTYASATANNILTDNASVLTLASSSKRHNRRHSLDTNASVRALAPSSAWGGSRESLPLSVLSGTGTIDSSAPPTANGPGPGSIGSGPFHSTQTRSTTYSGLAMAERASGYTSSGVPVPDRSSSYNPQKERFADGSSMRSGLLAHGRTESMTGSIGSGMLPGNASGGTPLTSPREASFGRSRRSVDMKDGAAEHEVDDEEEEEEGEAEKAELHDANEANGAEGIVEDAAGEPHMDVGIMP